MYKILTNQSLLSSLNASMATSITLYGISGLKLPMASSGEIVRVAAVTIFVSLSCGTVICSTFRAAWYVPKNLTNENCEPSVIKSTMRCIKGALPCEEIGKPQHFLGACGLFPAHCARVT